MKPLIFFYFFLFSCSNYINRVHSEIDESNRKTKKNQEGRDFSLFPNEESRNNQKLAKNFDPAKNMKTTQENFWKDEESGSLWDEENDSSYYFIDNIQIKKGQIITISVNKELRNNITLELSRVFRPKNTDTTKDKAATTPKPAEDSTGTNQDEKKEDDQQAFDQIPAVIVEIVGAKHIILKGRKEVLYHARKRLVEIQCLVKRDSVSPNNTIKSKDFIEFNIMVLR